MPRISVAVGERRTLGMLPGDFAEDALGNDAGPIGTYPKVNPLAQVMMSGSRMYNQMVKESILLEFYAP